MISGGMRSDLINSSDLEILSEYNALIRGLAEYYKIGTFWKRQLGRLHHLWWRSLMNTLSRKHKCSVSKTVQRLRNGERHGIWNESHGKRRFMRVFWLNDVSPAPTSTLEDIPPQTSI